jgi:ubiquinone/menaquinone biosynthesis C-methylase UbiE
MSTPDARSRGFLGNFANVDQADAAELVGRLDTMHALEFFRAYKRETFSLMRLEAGASAADVGCGTGEDARQLADVVGRSGCVVGFDISEAMLKEASSRHGASGSNIRFIQSGADDLKAPSSSFDAIRADRVLTHVHDVAAALREMMRVVKPGGRVVVSEPDMLGCWVNNAHHATSARILQAIAHSCASPFAARELYHHFRDAGLADVRLLLRPVALTDPQSADNILRFGTAIETMVAKGGLDAGEARAWLADFEERRRTGRFLGGATIFILVGVKPAGDQR